MADSPDKDQDPWLSKWEDETVHEWDEKISDMEDRVQTEMELNSQSLWQRFQNSATAISHLYKDQPNSVALWVPFQNSASCVTILYKDGLDIAKRALELGIQYGQQRRTKDLLTWAKKRRRNIRREDLLGHLCGRSVPPRHSLHHHRPTSTLTRSNSLRLDRTSPRLSNHPSMIEEHKDMESDLQPFRDALALQGLNGAMSNVSVSYQAQGISGPECPPPGHMTSTEDYHRFVELSRNCDTRKRTTSSTDVIMDSPTRKKSRLL